MNLIDPLGLFSWDKFFKGLTAVFVGVVAVAAVIATGGAATPIVAAGLAVTATAGTTSAIFGAYDIYESVTDKNPLKDAIGETTYETVELGTSMLASAGTGWIATNPQNFNKYYETDSNVSGKSLCDDDFDVPDDVYNFIKENGLSVEETLETFEGTPNVIVLEEDTIVYRYWGGKSSELGHWVSPVDYGSNVRDMLSLPDENTAEFMTEFIIPKGTTVLTGVASAFHKNTTGGGIQWWVSHVEK